MGVRERGLGGCPGVGEARADAWAQVGYVASKFCEFDTHPSCQIRKLRVYPDNPFLKIFDDAYDVMMNL